MRIRNIITLLILLLVICASLTEAQSAFAIKKWKGRYPRMNNDYPVSFVCWKGWLPPVPHFFVRIYPTHYYYYLNSLPVYDAKSYLNMGLYDGLKLVLKNIDKEALQKSMEEVSGIQVNQLIHQGIEDVLRQSRLTALPDIYQTSAVFYEAIQALDGLKQANVSEDITEGFERDIQNYLEELLLINQLDAEQGGKVQAMADINQSLRQLTGTIHYTAHKIASYQQQSQPWTSSLSFLGSL
ncbi:MULTISPECIES: hypothetical protein [unclassified Carboxylicivirga]|uniref:hypothetical protein n=1 Tax=Carboxylicivirga TaxID=1628153 RepID=UPI003D34DE13